MGKIVATDPDLSKPVFRFQHLLPFVIKSTEKHLQILQIYNLFIVLNVSQSIMAQSKSASKYRIQMQQDPHKPPLKQQSSTDSLRHYSIQFHKYEDIHERISLVASCKSSSLAKISGIVESYKNLSYTLSYEKCLHMGSEAITNVSKDLQIESLVHKIRSLMSFLLNLRIKPRISVENFGFTKEYELKFYLFPDYDVLEVRSSPEIQFLAEKCIQQCIEVFKIQVVQPKISKPLSFIAEKLRRLKMQMFELQIRNKDSFRQSSLNNSSDRSMPARIKAYDSKQRNMVDKRKRSFEDSYSYRDTKKRKIFSHGEGQQCSEANWGQKSEQSKSVQNTEYPSRDVLKERVSIALKKTQQTLTKYDKIMSKK